VRRATTIPDVDARVPDDVVDAKRLIAWARRHAGTYGGDPGRIVIAGSSAGAHIAMTAALTVNDPAFQRGFGYVDTTVAAAIGPLRLLRTSRRHAYRSPLDTRRLRPR
jgi:acetyl esterase/lipase